MGKESLLKDFNSFDQVGASADVSEGSYDLSALDIASPKPVRGCLRVVVSWDLYGGPCAFEVCCFS